MVGMEIRGCTLYNCCPSKGSCESGEWVLEKSLMEYGKLIGKEFRQEGDQVSPTACGSSIWVMVGLFTKIGKMVGMLGLNRTGRTYFI